MSTLTHTRYPRLSPDTRFWLLCGGMVVSYALVFGIAACYKHHSFWMGFDLGVHEQVLWNTMHGRLAAISPKGATQSYLGVDIIIVELLLTPLYALVPRTETMLIIQTTVAASGAIPLAILARGRVRGSERERMGWGVFAVFLYMAALPIQYAILYEFQIRTMGTVFFLWAFLFFERERFWFFLLFGILAIWTRSDGSLPLATMGMYALVRRRPWWWVVGPMVVGGGWLLLCLKVLIPAFRDDHGFLYGFVYAWLGDSPAAIIQTVILRPGYVLEQVVTPGKMRYLVELFGPLLFLPLLRADVSLLAVPTLLLNLLSREPMHWSIRYHYQSFAIPFLLIATIYALIPPPELSARDCHVDPGLPCPWRPWLRPHWWISAGFRRWYRWAPAIAGVLVVVALASQVVVIRSPLIHLVTRPRDQARIALAKALIALVPKDVPLTATSAFGAHLARRRELYFFPGNIIYPPEFVERGTYLLVDRREVPEEAMAQLQRIQQSPSWQVLIDRDQFLLLKRTVEQALDANGKRVTHASNE